MVHSQANLPVPLETDRQTHNTENEKGQRHAVKLRFLTTEIPPLHNIPVTGPPNKKGVITNYPKDTPFQVPMALP